MTRYKPMEIPETLADTDTVIVPVSYVGAIPSSVLWAVFVTMSVWVVALPVAKLPRVIDVVRHFPEEELTASLLLLVSGVICMTVAIVMVRILLQVGRSFVSGYAMTFSKEGISIPGLDMLPWSDVVVFDVGPRALGLVASAFVIGRRKVDGESIHVSFAVRRLVHASTPQEIAYALYRSRDRWAPGHEIALKADT